MKVKFLNGHEEEFETLAGAALVGADLRGEDLRGEDLSVADLRCANLHGAALDGANLWGADMTWANLCMVDLTGADMRGAYLRGAALQGADLRCANLRGATLEGADLRGAKFEDAAMPQDALVGTILDKEQYARLRDILDEVGKTVDDEGTRAQAKRDREIHDHYEHAKETHPVFADILTHSENTSAKHYKRLRDEAHAAGECSPLQVFLAEYAEVLEAIAVEDKAQAVYECYDCIAVLLRLVDMIEETAEKEEWKEV